MNITVDYLSGQIIFNLDKIRYLKIMKKNFYGINKINYKIYNQINTNTNRIKMLKVIMILYWFVQLLMVL